MKAEFGQLQFERRLEAAPSRVFEALISAEDRMAWGPPDTGSVVLIDGQPAAAPGARELSRCGPRDNPYVDVATDWILIEAPSRLIYAETLTAEGAPLGTSLATNELESAGGGTVLRLTVQLVSFVGAEMMGEFEHGWRHAMDGLAAHLEPA
ncbi:MAG: SRPBCC domain-containing protein [Pseudomonadota bacterium]